MIGTSLDAEQARTENLSCSTFRNITRSHENGIGTGLPALRAEGSDFESW